VVRSSRVFTAVDSQTEGMPTRVITSSIDVLPGLTCSSARSGSSEATTDFEDPLMNEPRGHAAMSGAILQPPCRDDADWGVVLIDGSGCSPMRGHGTIGVATRLLRRAWSTSQNRRPSFGSKRRRISSKHGFALSPATRRQSASEMSLRFCVDATRRDRPADPLCRGLLWEFLRDRGRLVRGPHGRSRAC
jgi:hypothetical protein